MQGGANLNHTNIFLPINTPPWLWARNKFFLSFVNSSLIWAAFTCTIYTKNLYTMKNTITTVKNKTTLQDPSSKNHHKMAWGDLGHSTDDKIKNYLLKLIHPPFDEVISRRASKSNIHI